MSNSRTNKALSLFTAAVLTLVSFVIPATPVLAQATSGNIVGTVTDAAGGAVVGAKVTARNKATGQELTDTSSGEGTF
ncbi:MAG: carboxypeptidase-like regulatory domain-containing protein, partial [Acidobacteria bacterium]|nr:carboxypeptidase-like regulatory domain-containing protein [Acidobacteriota bacterium]